MKRFNFFLLLGLTLTHNCVSSEDAICNSDMHIYERIDCYDTLNVKLKIELKNLEGKADDNHTSPFQYS